MVGLGKADKEIEEAIQYLYKIDCDTVTIGQYFQVSPENIPFTRFVRPEKFKAYEEYAHHIKLKNMSCGPLIRPSYQAVEIKENYHE